MDTKIEQKITNLADDHVHGANWLSIQAINILNTAITISQAQTVSELLDKIHLIAKAIIKARPNMISINNYVTQFLEELSHASRSQQDLEAVKQIAINKADEQIMKMKKSALQAATNGADIIEDNDTVISCSYSSTLCKAIEFAKQRAIEFKFIIAESRFNNKSYGRLCANQLEQFSIQPKLIPDKSISRYIHSSNKAMVGADTILFDGSLINGSPSHDLALFASQAGIPFYTICEIAKLDRGNYYGNHVKHIGGFDRIPPQLISGIITETGIIKPSEVSQYRSRY